MKMIIRPRGGGKTTELIRIANKTDAIIVCFSDREVNRIYKQANMLDLPIRKPISYRRLLIDNDMGLRIVKEEYLIDELDKFLSQIGNIKAFTMTPDEPIDGYFDKKTFISRKNWEEMVERALTGGPGEYEGTDNA